MSLRNMEEWKVGTIRGKTSNVTSSEDLTMMLPRGRKLM